MVVAKIGLTGARCNHQRIICVSTGELILLGSDGLVSQVDIGNLGVNEVNIILIAQQLAGGRGHLTGGNHACCYLVQHRLEQVVVLLIDESDFYIGVL